MFLAFFTVEFHCFSPGTSADLFDDIHRHTLHSDEEALTVFATELSALQRRILKLLGVPAIQYRGRLAGGKGIRKKWKAEPRKSGCEDSRLEKGEPLLHTLADPCGHGVENRIP